MIIGDDLLADQGFPCSPMAIRNVLRHGRVLRDFGYGHNQVLASDRLCRRLREERNAMETAAAWQLYWIYSTLKRTTSADAA